MSQDQPPSNYPMVPAVVPQNQPGAQPQQPQIEIPQAVLNQQQAGPQNVLISVEEIVAIYRRYIWGGLILGGLLAAFAFSKLQFREPVYSAETLIKMKAGRAEHIEGIDGTGSYVSEMGMEAEMKSFQVLATSHKFLADLYPKLKEERPDILENFYAPPKKPTLKDKLLAMLPKKEPKTKGTGGPPPPERTFGIAMKKHIEVSIVPDTKLIRFTFSHFDGMLVSELANFTTEKLIDYHIDQTVKKTLKYRLQNLENSIIEAKAEAEDAQKALTAYRQEHKILDLGEAEANAEMDQRRKQLFAIETEIDELNAVLKTIEKAKLISSKTERDRLLLQISEIAKSPGISAVQEALLKSETEAASLKATYGSDHPEVEKCNASIAYLKRQLSEEIEEAVTAVESETASELSRQQESMKKIDEKLQEFVDAGPIYIKDKQLASAYETAQATAESIGEQLTNTKLMLKMETSDRLTISEEALPQTTPSSPSLVVSLAGAFVLGCMGLFGFPVLAWGRKFLTDLWKRSDPKKMAEEAAAMEQIAEETAKANENPQLALGGSHPESSVLATFPKLSGHSVSELIRLATDPSSQHGRMLESGILQILNSNNRRILLASMNSGEGKTISSMALACSAASTGKKVLLVEANEPSPCLDRWINSDNDIPAGPASVRDAFNAVQAGNSSLHVITQNSWKVNADLCYDVIDEADSLVDLMIVDGPSIQNGGNWEFIKELRVNNIIIVKNPAMGSSENDNTQSVLAGMLPGTRFSGSIVNQGPTPNPTMANQPQQGGVANYG